MRIQMRIQKLLAAAAMAFLTSAGAASASSIPITFTYSVSYSATNGNGPSFTDDLGTAGSYSANIGSTQTTPTNFFTASPAGSCGSGCVNNTASGTVTVSFTGVKINGVSVASFSETATYQAKYGGTALSCTNSPSGDTDCIDWTGATNGGPTGLLTVPVTGALDMYLANASDWAISPQISFQDTPVGVPGPVAGSGLPGLALAGIGLFVGWRRRRQIDA
jgi:MYXO-CTERM domain-containing protein